MNLRTSILFLALAASALQAQDVPFARGPGPSFDLWVADEAGLSASVPIHDVVFEPLVLTGYARRERMRMDLPRPDTRGPTTSVSLPNGGRLLGCRLGPPGSQVASLLQVGIDGSLTSHLERALGPGGEGLLPELHVSRDGSQALVATTMAAGGDVWLVNLNGIGAPRSLTSSLPPLPVEPLSLRVSADRAWFMSQDVLYRADLKSAGSAMPVDLALPPGTTPLPELACSLDGKSVAVVAQDAAAMRLVVVVDASGLATTVTETATGFVTPNYNTPTGPWLALSPNGSLLATRRTVNLKHELFICRTNQVAPAVQVTGNTNFTDTIDGIGVIGFLDEMTVTFAAGEIQVGTPLPSIGSADIYSVTASHTGTSLQNITQTSGFASPPYIESGTLEILDALEDPLGERLLLIIDPDAGDYGLLSVPLDGGLGFSTLIPGLAAAPVLEPSGEHLFVLAPLDDLPGASQNVFLLRPAGSVPSFQLLGVVPAGLTLDRFAYHQASGKAAFVMSLTPDLELPVLIHLPTSMAALVWHVPFAVGPRIAFTPSGHLAATVGVAGGPLLFASFSAPLVGQVLPLPLGLGYPLAP